MVVCGADPLNLTGIIPPGERIPATPGNRILYRNGLATAVLAGGDIHVLVSVRPNEEWQFRQLLTGATAPAGTSAAWRMGA